MPTPEQLRAKLAANMGECERLDVHGPDGVHFEALIVSSLFTDKSLVQRHQMVYQALGDMMREEIHALSMRTLTPTEWRRREDGG